MPVKVNRVPDSATTRCCKYNFSVVVSSLLLRTHLCSTLLPSEDEEHGWLMSQSIISISIKACCNDADWGSVTTDDANQNAALAAIMFLAGGVGKDSPHCIITLVGSDPTVRPLSLNRKQALAMVDQRAHDVLREKVNHGANGTPCD